MDAFLNWGILRVPTNWLIVAVAVILGLFAAHFALVLIHGAHGSNEQKHPSKIQ